MTVAILPAWAPARPMIRGCRHRHAGRRRGGLIDSPPQLCTIGHGRILLAKSAVGAALLVVAWRNRAVGWRPRCR